MRRGLLTAALAAVALGAVDAGAQLPPLDPEPSSRPAKARIAFAADADVYTLAADGSDRRRLTTTDGRHSSSEPAWSPDGSLIAFVRDLTEYAPEDSDEDDVQRSQIWVMRPDGSEQRAYAFPSPPGSYDSAPAWSPDGSQIAFVRVRFRSESIESSLFVTGPDGFGERELVRTTARNTLTYLGTPAWSPDGGTILYSRTTLGREAYFRSDLYAVAPGGGTPRRLASSAGDPAWSPDGRRIAYVSTRDRNGERCGSDECYWAGELYVMNADGGGRTRLTNGDGDEHGPSWSADGARIAFGSDRNYPQGESPELYSVAADGSCLTWLTNGTADSGAPSWQPGSAPTDPGECGAAQRPVLNETDATAATSFAAHPVLWLGTESRDGLLLSDVSTDEGAVDLVYEDCSRYEPRDCPPGVQISNVSSCTSSPLVGAGYRPRDVTRRGGALVYRNTHGEGYPEVYAGVATVRLFTDDNRRAAGYVPQLRVANGPNPGALPLARLPVRFWNRIERAAAARRKYGTAGAARRLGHSRTAIKERAAIHRRLRQLGRFGRLECER